MVFQRVLHRREQRKSALLEAGGFARFLMHNDVDASHGSGNREKEEAVETVGSSSMFSWDKTVFRLHMQL